MIGLTSYPTFLVFLACVIAAAVTMALMPVWIRALKSGHIGQQVRDDGPETHLVKQGTPTMGGVIMLVAIIVAVIIACPLNAYAIAALLATVATGLLGFIDDSSKVINQRSLGLTPKGKLVGQFVISAAFILYVVNFLDIQPTVTLPFICTIDLGVLDTVLPIGAGFHIPWLYLVFCLLLTVGMSNATNLTDGLDGLAAGTVMVSMIIMAAIGFRCNNLAVAGFCATMAGACVGFLWYNTYPADIFMGDTGSLALGMGLACVAILTKTEVVSLIIGGLFVAEALSVIIQVAYFKRTRKRIFLMAPLHHHFEKKGWSETKVVIRFWIVSGVLGAAGFVVFFISHMS